jgi:hypothetical protein
MTIFSLLICLFAVLAMRTMCAQGVANLFKAMEPPVLPDGGAHDAAPPANPQNH